MELDHVFIATQFGAPAAEALLCFGLEEGSRNSHAGQGTSNRRFFFHNAMLELLWIESEAEARSGDAARLALAERCGTCADVSPFGICFRPSPGNTAPGFPTWSYRPDYLPGTWSVEIAEGASAWEPLWFFIGFSGRPDGRRPGAREPVDHPSGLREISSLRVTLPMTEKLSHSAECIDRTGLVTLVAGAGHLLELGFDGQTVGHSHDFRPELPLVFHW